MGKLQRYTRGSGRVGSGGVATFGTCQVRVSIVGYCRVAEMLDPHTPLVPTVQTAQIGMGWKYVGRSQRQ